MRAIQSVGLDLQRYHEAGLHQRSMQRSRFLTNAQLLQEGRLRLVLETKGGHEHVAGQALAAGQQQRVVLNGAHCFHLACDAPRPGHLEDGIVGLACRAGQI